MDYPDKRKEIGACLQSHRKKAGFKSAKAFAESIGFNPNTYTQYEQGLTRFNYEQAWIMADALHCTLDELGGREFGEDFNPAPDERELIGKYRLMDAPERDKLKGVADSFVIASEKDGPGSSRDVRGIGRDLTEIRR